MIVRPRFIKGMEVMTLPALKPPPLLNIKEEIINRRPVYLKTQPHERKSDPVKAYITQRSDNIKNMITSSGLKVDMSHLQDKLFPIEYEDEFGATQRKEVRLLDMNLPVEERLKAIQAAIAAKDLNATEKASLASIVGIAGSQLALRQLSEQQRDLLADLLNSIAPVKSYLDVNLERFHDEITYNDGKAVIKTFLTMQKKPVQTVTTPVKEVKLDDIEAYLQGNTDQLLDLKTISFIMKTDAMGSHTSDYNQWDAAKTKLTPSTSSGPPVPPKPPPPPPNTGIPPFVVPDRSTEVPKFDAVMDIHYTYRDLTFPDPDSAGRKLLDKWGSATAAQKSKIRDQYWGWMDRGETDRRLNLLKLKRGDEILNPKP